MKGMEKPMKIITAFAEGEGQLVSHKHKAYFYVPRPVT